MNQSNSMRRDDISVVRVKELIMSNLNLADSFLDFVFKEHNHLYEKLISSLPSYLDQISTPQIHSIRMDLENFLHINTSILNSIINLVLHKIDFEKNEELFSEVNDDLEAELSLYSYIIPAQYAIYHIVNALENQIDRNELHSLAKEYTEYSHNHSKRRRPHMNKPADLREFMDPLITKTHNFTSCIDKHGNYALKVHGCIDGYAMQQFEDRELIYSLVCYGDYFSAAKYNLNFKLTRTKTVLQGQSCCDFYYQDKRNEVEHPDLDFWKEMQILH
ncbi:MAG: L-2-amino-thiazoline-4-carboxylic acid hydrolase [Candidatus Heimdallarchaeota archaeon]|nr:L-2-amino-thiazoline-4-carboxylic acid hydrolase [Candidatus Heimdallarchaeota archaeon]